MQINYRVFSGDVRRFFAMLKLLFTKVFSVLKIGNIFKADQS
jgi:hypothetical protein